MSGATANLAVQLSLRQRGRGTCCGYSLSRLPRCPGTYPPEENLLLNGCAECCQPITGPGSWRYRRLFGADDPVSWAQLELVSRDCPVTIAGLYEDDDETTYVVAIHGAGIRITPCRPTGSWHVDSNTLNHTACNARFDFAAAPTFPATSPMSGLVVLGRFARIGPLTTLTFISDQATVLAVWRMIDGSCPS